MFPHGDTATRLRATPIVSPYSGETTGQSWDDPDELEIPGCAFDPGTSTEPLEQGRNAVVTRPSLLAPVGVDVKAGDRIEVYSVEERARTL